MDSNSTLADYSLVITSSHGPVEDKATWSGTPARVHEFFRPRVKECHTLNYQLPRWGNLPSRITRKALGAWPCSRNVYLNWLYERQFLRAWRKLGTTPQLCLHISDFCIPRPLPGTVRHFAYVDATLMQVAKHHRFWVSPFCLRHYRRLTRRYLDSMTMMFTQNEWARESYIHDYGMAPERVLNTGFGVNVVPYHGAKNYDEELLLIILRRNTEYVKGLDLLLAALPLVRQARPRARLAVVGTSRPEKMAGVDFYEGFPREKTLELLQQATLYTMPAICEPNGIAYLEGLANQAPIVALDRFAAPEFAGHGRFGFLIPEATPEAVARGIVEALSDKARLRQMGETGQQFVLERYTWPRALEEMHLAILASI